MPAPGRGLSVTEVERLYQCVVCPKAYSSKQSLRAHMKVHKGEYLRTTIYAPRDLWPRFDAICKAHKTTTCHLLKVLVKAVVDAGDTGVIDLAKLGSPNPLIINVNEYFLGKPRSAWKQQLDIDALARLQRRCPECGSSDVYEFQPELSRYLDGRCRRCGAQWLIAPGVDPGSTVLPTRGR